MERKLEEKKMRNLETMLKVTQNRDNSDPRNLPM